MSSTNAATPDPAALVRRHRPHGRKTIKQALHAVETSRGLKLWRVSEIVGSGWGDPSQLYGAIAKKQLKAIRICANRFLIEDGEIERFLRERAARAAIVHERAKSALHDFLAARDDRQGG